MQANALNEFVQSVLRNNAVSFKKYTGARMDKLVENVDKNKIVHRTPLQLVIKYDRESQNQQYYLYHIQKGKTGEDIRSELAKLFLNADKQYAFMAVTHMTDSGFCHMNTLIFSYQDLTVRLFEPHGTPRVKMVEMIGKFFYDLMPQRRANVKKWKFTDMTTPPGKNHEGLQIQGEHKCVEKGLCVLWNFYVVQYIIRNGLNITKLYDKSRNRLRTELLKFFGPFWEKVKSENVNQNKNIKFLHKKYKNQKCYMSQPIDLTRTLNVVNLT